jgi:hypothetical protein
MASPSATVLLSPAASAPSATPTITLTASPSPSGSALQASPAASDHWRPDAALVAAKNQGRVTIVGGQVVVVDTPPAPVNYPASAKLDTRWTSRIQEPPPKGKDDHDVAYFDSTYAVLCGPGAATVVLYYWSNSYGNVTTKSGTFTEPVNIGKSWRASTFWVARDEGGYGRGMIMYIAMEAWPEQNKNKSWWSRPGLMNWSNRPPSTEVPNMVDLLNWEASGHQGVSYFYVSTPSSELTQQTLLDHVHSDINAGVPVLIAAAASNGTVALPNWSVTSRISHSTNHFVTVVGYDDRAGTYDVMDTCGYHCNTLDERGSVRSIRQIDLFTLIMAESDADGIIW